MSQLKTINQALLAFHALLPTISKDKKVSAGAKQYKYAPLDVIQEAIKQPLLDCGLYYSQYMVESGLKTIIYHDSGEEKDCGAYPIIIQGLDSQKVGSAYTYARRYSLASALGLTIADEDDDGQAASNVNLGQQSTSNTQSYSEKPKYNDDGPTTWLSQQQFDALIASKEKDQIITCLNLKFDKDGNKFAMKKDFRSALSDSINNVATKSQPKSDDLPVINMDEINPQMPF